MFKRGTTQALSQLEREEGGSNGKTSNKGKTDVNVVVCIKEESGKYTWRIAKARQATPSKGRREGSRWCIIRRK